MAGMSKIPAELEAEMTPGVRAFVESLLERIAVLEKQVGATPQNSSLPPSTQHPHAKPPAKAKNGEKKKRGGQPGHAKKTRELIPTEQCDEVVTLKPSECRRCGAELNGEDADPWRHQVYELPEIKPHVTEYQRHRLPCPCCRETTCAELPEGVPTGMSGPGVVAFAGLLMSVFRQSKRRVAVFMQQILRQPYSPGLAVKHQNIVADALREPYQELASQLPTQKSLHADESPTKQAGDKAWLWTFVAPLFTVFALRLTRKAHVPAELLTKRFRGVVICDRAKMYWRLGLSGKRRHRLQWCWAHLQRDFQKLIDSADNTLTRLGRDLMRPTRELFRHWARCRDGTISRRQLKRDLEPIRKQVEALLLRGHGTAADGMCRELYAHRDWLWTFLTRDGVEPTNNAGERALRHAVIWRKLSFGTQSAAGSRFVETTLSVIETCRQQSRNVFEYVTAAVQARFHGRTAPSLLPGV